MKEVMQKLQPIVAKVLRISEMELKADIPLINYGISSLMTLVLVQKINKNFSFQSIQDDMSINHSLNSLAQLIYEKLTQTPSDSYEH